MLSAESQVDVVIDWWKDKGLTRKSLVFSELIVSGKVPVILLFSNPVGLITCKRW